MATIRIYLDTRSKKKDGTYPLKLAVNHKGQTAMFPIEVSLKKAQWDGRTQRVMEHPNKQQLQKYLDNVAAKATTTLLDAKLNGVLKGMDISGIRDLVRKAIDPDFGNEDKMVTFCNQFKTVMDRHTNQRTHEIYLMTLQWMKRYDARLERLTFEQVTRDWLQGFFDFMSESSPSINARNIHLRNIRTVFNDAIDNELTTAYPFRKFKIRPQATSKRNLKAEQLRNLFRMECKPHQRKYVDAFKLSFLLCGINIGDLCLLMPDNVNGDRLEYHRQKTRKFYSIKIEREARELMEQYKGRERLLSFAERCKRHPYKAFAMRMNKTLRELMPSVTTYWARHSWATVAAFLEIPDDTISLALGHAARNSTTAIYIERDLHKVDAANRRVIDYVLYGIK